MAMEQMHSVFSNSIPYAEVDSRDAFQHAVAKEFIPEGRDDPMLPILREVFEQSFKPYYTHILTDLHLAPSKSLDQWLIETFDDLQEHLFDKSWRCFILCERNNEHNVIGIMTAKSKLEEDGSLYVAQFCVNHVYKRRGYGGVLLQYLFQAYPNQKKFIGLCRKANEPAIEFYYKYGAKRCTDENIATRWGYDPKIYFGLEFDKSALQPPAQPKLPDSLSDWTQDHVKSFLLGLELDNTILPLFSRINGRHLLHYYGMYENNSDKMYEQMKTELVQLHQKVLPIRDYLIFVEEIKKYIPKTAAGTTSGTRPSSTTSS